MAALGCSGSTRSLRATRRNCVDQFRVDELMTSRSCIGQSLLSQDCDVSDSAMTPFVQAKGELGVFMSGDGVQRG